MQFKKKFGLICRTKFKNEISDLNQRIPDFCIICIFIMKEKLRPIFLALLCATACKHADMYPKVSTYAGTGRMAFADGKPDQACFANLMGIAADDAGNLYIADSHNNRIRKITTDGNVMTIAGSGLEGSSDGKAEDASFFYPTGVAVDKNGNVYVSDTHNNLIRKISSGGIVTTLAGRRTKSLDISSDTSSDRFDTPTGIAVDLDGNLYVADSQNEVIRKISSSGKVSILAGSVGEPGATDGVKSSALFYLPWGIAVDSSSNVYVADSYNNMIRKISADGLVTTLAGKKSKGSSDGLGAAASFLHPAGIAMDREGNLYIADSGNHKIRKMSSTGLVTTVAGSGLRGHLNGRDTVATFYKPYGVAIDRQGTIYVADYLNNLVRKVSY
jgi:sugar lactone lactonase YvrE